MSEIEARVKAIIVDKLGVDESEVTPNASFTNDLGADSLDTVELIMELEKEFGMSIPDDQAENISTVQDAIDYIANNANLSRYCDSIIKSRSNWYIPIIRLFLFSEPNISLYCACKPLDRLPILPCLPRQSLCASTSSHHGLLPPEG